MDYVIFRLVGNGPSARDCGASPSPFFSPLEKCPGSKFFAEPRHINFVFNSKTMGKAGNPRKKDGKRKGSLTASRPPTSAEKAANNALRESMILPVVRNLSSTSPKERAEAVSAINNLLQDAACRQLLLHERVVQRLMEEMLNDSSQEVVVYAWGALRNISVDEGYDQSIFMYRKNILTPVSSALQKV